MLFKIKHYVKSIKQFFVDSVHDKKSKYEIHLKNVITDNKFKTLALIVLFVSKLNK